MIIYLRIVVLQIQVYIYIHNRQVHRYMWLHFGMVRSYSHLSCADNSFLRILANSYICIRQPSQRMCRHLHMDYLHNRLYLCHSSCRSIQHDKHIHSQTSGRHKRHGHRAQININQSFRGIVYQ